MSIRMLLAWLCCLAYVGLPRVARAHATFQLQSSDGASEGFNDPTPVDAVGGNEGRTLGEQRRIALMHAAELWGQALDSDVPIAIEAAFDDMGCSTTGTLVLAAAATSGLEEMIDSEGTDPGLLYPEALADRLAGSDLAPGQPDILATFNSSVDADCIPGSKWYYGLDGDHGPDQDLVLTALHELGHGLGVQVFVDPETGDTPSGTASAYSTHVLDLSTGKHWSDMTSSERIASYANVRHVVWDGASATAAAAERLIEGTPTLQTNVAGMSGFAGDAAFGGPLASSVSAQLSVAASDCTTPVVAGRIVLLRDGCAYSSWAANKEEQGALGVVLAWSGLEWSSPPPSIEESDPASVGIPVLTVSDADATLLVAAAQSGSVSVALSLGAGLRGADAQGRVLLNATSPASAGSAISHWDELARPNLLMEPILKPGAAHDLDITPAMLADLGWVSLCGNERLDPDEQCDDGADNDDAMPDACRTNCRRARCGDGVEDHDERCDHGADNSDKRANACRSDCTPARCGDGVRDDAEACDRGEANSDAIADACRGDCSKPRCGDGVRDEGEKCDDGADNSDTKAGACRRDCARAACGDGVRDEGEECDDGADNSDTAPNACRADCRSARCGDGVRDKGEECDDGADNSDTAPNACRADCRSARCGDGVRDEGELCDRGGAAGDCQSDCVAADCDASDCEPADAAVADKDAPAPSGADKPSPEGGCGCRIGRQSASHLPGVFGLGLCAWLLRLRHRRARRSESSRDAMAASE